MHDARMLDTSGLYVDLAHFAFSPAGQEKCIHGDPAYPLHTHLQCPCTYKCGMVVWRPYKLFQVSRLQKKSQNWP